jgi:hypothetical protein
MVITEMLNHGMLKLNCSNEAGRTRGLRGKCARDCAASSRYRRDALDFRAKVVLRITHVR